MRGLGVFPGRVVRFAADPERKVPHMGWNDAARRAARAGARRHAPTARTCTSCTRTIRCRRIPTLVATTHGVRSRVRVERRARQRVRRASSTPRRASASDCAARRASSRRARASGGMTVYPAIDLRGGRCVRLLQGEFDRETVYGDDPVAVARRWEAAGARWLHVVDLDGARAGRPVQHELVRAICAAVAHPGAGGRRAPRRGGRRPGARPRARRASCSARRRCSDPALRARPLRAPSRPRSPSASTRAAGASAIGGWTEERRSVPARRLARACARARRGGRHLHRHRARRHGARARTSRARARVARRRRGAGDRVGRRRLARARARAWRRSRARRAASSSGGRSTRARSTLAAALAVAAGRLMLARRIIPCLDVKGGRVVKGVRFVELRDAGDPVEIAEPLRRRGRRRADVPRHHGVARGAADHPRRRRAHGRAHLHAAHRRRRRAHGRRRARAAHAPARTRCRSTRPRSARPGVRRRGRRALRHPVRGRRDRRAPPRRRRPGPRLGGVHARRAHADRPRRRSTGRRAWRARARARSSSPAWIATARGSATTSS